MKKLFTLTYLFSLFIWAISTKAQVTNGLIQHFKFDNSFTNEAGNVTFSATAFTTNRDGVPNSAILINTSTLQSEATIPGLPYGNSARTISFWAKSNGFSGLNYDPVFTYGTGTNSNSFSGSFSVDRVMVNAHTDNVTYMLGGGTQNIAGTWYHFTMTYDGTTVKLYRNGVAMGPGLAKNWNTINNNDIFKLGIGVGGEKWFSGAIDDLKIFDRAVDASEAEQLYKGTIDVCSNLLGYFGFDENTLDHTETIAFTTTDGPMYPISRVVGRRGGTDYALQTFQAATQPREAIIPGLPTGNTQRTIVFWMRTTTPFTTGQNYFTYGAAANAQTFGLYNNASGTLVFQGFGSGNDVVATGATIGQNSWAQIALVHTSYMVKVFVNGVQRYSFTPTTTLNTANSSFKIGAFNGAVDDLAVYSRALTFAEIENLYNNSALNCPFPVGTGSFPIVYDFDNSRTNTAGLNTFSTSGTSFVNDRANNTLKAISLTKQSVANISIIPKGNTARTISIWYKVSSNANSIIYTYGANAANKSFGLYLGGANGNPVFYSNTTDKNFGGTYAANTWHHAVITYDGSTVKMYMNGSLVGSEPYTLATEGNGNFRIGNDITTVAVDDLRIFNYAVSDADVANLYMGNNVLPVNLISFTAKAHNNSVALTWETGSETNNRHFVIKRSLDGINFSTLNTVPAKSANGATYQFTDNNPAAGTNYYQLLQVDLDGTPKDLGIKSVSFALQNTVKVFPNPTTEKAEITFNAGSFTNAKLTDVNGKILQKISIGKLQHSIILSLINYPKGLYLLQLKGDKEKLTQKIVKQ
ncbi:MAG: LamG-like jellyroll fold domain-containing protein [Pedobacter sp.]|uniref:LamG-like jellyroll fold domain-containing protein n=1 Tax=Pedobacter sp. TaxID=1411316 RepID=UPI0028097494|nr:LamG-like jellyroll fold domain-containing protein [Pedobacter sp.]MDQ8005741.1 LamG-like jellyroll fold domain-containing protein [Pedobacter sp.]